MKEKIGRLARGQIEKQKAVLTLSPASVERTIPYGEPVQGEFRLVSENGVPFRGLVYSSDCRVRPLTGFCSGTDAHIGYEIAAEHFTEGDALSGSFYLVTSAGEFALPFSFAFHLGDETTEGRLATLEAFTLLAQEEPALAEQIFASPEFVSLPFMKDIALRSLYDGIRRSRRHEADLEEFLIAAGAKEPVRLSLPAETLCFEDAPEEEQAAGIRRDGFGRIDAAVSADAPFLVLKTQHLSEADFDGETAQIPFRIDPEKLERGTNTGYIKIETTKQTLIISVSVELESGGYDVNASGLTYTVRYNRARLDWLMGKKDAAAAAAGMREAVSHMRETRSNRLHLKLCEAEITQLEGRPDEAMQMLAKLAPAVRRVGAKNTDVLMFFYYLQNRIEKNWKTKEKILNIFARYTEGGRFSLPTYVMRLQVDESLLDRPTETLEILRRFYEYGSRSPYLYMEACRIFNRIPELLDGLGAFEQQTVLFGARHRFLGRETAKRYAELSLNENGASPLVNRALVLLAQAEPEEPLIRAVCASFIRMGAETPESFVWYQKGVETGVQMPRLFDSYIAALPEGTPVLPNDLYFYYSYDPPAKFRIRERLYENVAVNFPPGTAMYELFERLIREFVREQVSAGRIDGRLAVLYSHFLTLDMVDEDLAKILPEILCTYELRTRNRALRSVIVLYEELTGEQRVELTDGRAYLPVYTGRYHLLFADAAGRRYADDDYTLEKLITNKDDLLRLCSDLVPDTPARVLGEAASLAAQPELDVSQAKFLRYVADLRHINPLYREELLERVVHCYPWISETEETAFLLDCAGGIAPAGEEKRRLLRVLAEKGEMREAWRQITVTGYADLPVGLLQTICEGVIEKRRGEADALLTEAARTVFEVSDAPGKRICEYLCAHYNSLSARMWPVLTAARSRHYATADMAERLLAQMLFSGTYDDLEACYAVYDRTPVQNRLIVSAYRTVICHGYFMEGRPLSPEDVDGLRADIGGGRSVGGVPVIWCLALLRYFSENGFRAPEDAALCTALVQRLAEKEIVLPFFKQLPAEVALSEEVKDKTLISFRAAEGDRVVLLLWQEHKRDPAYSEMTHVYGGIYVGKVLLFEGERRRYKIGIAREEGTEYLEEGILQADITRPEEDRKFLRLNRLGAGLERPSDPAWQRAAAEYARLDDETAGLFGTM